MSKKPTVLMILDGYGLRDKTEGNAVALANTPVMDKLMAEYPFVKGNASYVNATNTELYAFNKVQAYNEGYIRQQRSEKESAVKMKTK